MSSSKDMVVWMPPPIAYVILNTRLAYKQYEDAITRLFVYEAAPNTQHEGFDIVDHMGEVGIMVVSLIRNKRTLEKHLRDLHNRLVVLGEVDDAQIYTKQMFGHLVRHCVEQCEAAQLYDGAGELHYAFYNWTAGNLVLSYNNSVVASP